MKIICSELTCTPLFPEHTCYIEPFCGSTALFFRKAPSKIEVLNDINGELINLYRVLKHHLDEILRHFRWSLISRQLREWLQMTKPETLTDIQRAAHFSYMQHMAFGGKVTGQMFGTSATRPRGMNLLRIEETLSEAHLRLSATTIEHLDSPKSIFFSSKISPKLIVKQPGKFRRGTHPGNQALPPPERHYGYSSGGLAFHPGYHSPRIHA
ncbi:Modification methylase DpnIIA [Serratia quinivorans]|uniref:site-specific DNA-methyltransferase (adenine-specific) n=1 Tax=Serratia quinivorans TaxID=137545 RepID=A0A380AHS3_9GAMM|nr:hypothetical protein BSR03_19730 [Serratia proteamaculans]SUI81348.1 Modification methylase DpnIIA [Serratia quinivorans]